MGSKSLETRQNQKARFLEHIEARTQQLKEKGLADTVIKKDSVLKSLSAKVRQINKAVSRIDFLGKQTAELEERKRAKAEAKAQEAEAGPQSKKKKKQAKKEEAAQAEAGKKGKGGGGKAKAPAAKGKAQAGKGKGK